MPQTHTLADEIKRWKAARRAATFTNRDFVSAVRTELASAGHPDIAFKRSWFDEDEPGYRLLVHVPVGTEMTIPLRAMDRYFDMRTRDELERNATEFAKALVNLKLAEGMLLRYARDVRRSANRAVAAARADGLDVLLDRVGFKPTYAYHLTWDKWRDAASHVLAEVTIRHTSFYFQPTTSTICVEEPADVEEELRDVLREQRTNQSRIVELDAAGADLTVDALTLDLLEAHGLDATEVLTQVWKEQCVNLKVEHRGNPLSLSLVSGDGRVSASLQLPGAHWNGEHLWFTDDRRDADHQHLLGNSLGDLMPHPVFSARPIVAVENRHIDHISFDLSDKLLFNADTGRLWRDQAVEDGGARLRAA